MFDIASVHRNESGALRVCCTTPVNVTSVARIRVRRAAEWFTCDVVRRGKDSLETLFRKTGADAIVVADEPLRVVLRANPKQPVWFHPGMALPRIAAMRGGQRDRLVRVARIGRGDVVLDATFGLAVDSLVLAAAVGDTGRVLACDSSWLLVRLFQYAQRYEGHLYPSLQPLLARIEAHCGDHVAVLQQMSDNAVDVVYFDPMFRHPLHNPSSDLESVRGLANPAPLAHDAWREALRVARRAVVLKERPDSGEFERFHLHPDKPRAKFAYGVAWKETAYERT